MENKTKYPKLVGEFGRYQFKDENDKLSEYFYYANDYSDGFALVKKRYGGSWQYRDKNGNWSEEFYDACNYRDGFACVQKKKDGPWQFRDKNGNLSEEFYFAYGYADGFACVHKKEDGPYQFRDTSGNLSEEFYYACNYSDGFATVQKEKDGPYQFRDVNGNLSEEFYFVYGYNNGFARVCKEKSAPLRRRDMLGRLTGGKTKSGEDFYKFYQGKIELEDLDDEHFLDPIFCNGVIKECEKRYLKYIEGKYSKNEVVDEALEVEQAKNIITLIDLKQKIATYKESVRKADFGKGNAGEATFGIENEGKKVQLKRKLEGIFDKQYEN